MKVTKMQVCDFVIDFSRKGETDIYPLLLTLTNAQPTWQTRRLTYVCRQDAEEHLKQSSSSRVRRLANTSLSNPSSRSVII